MSSPDSVERLRHDLVSVTETITNLVKTLGEQGKEIEQLKIASLLQAEREKGIKDHLARIDVSLANIYSLGRYFLFAFCTSLIGAFVLFIVKGGLHVSS